MNRREQDRAAAGQLARADLLAGPLVVAAVGQHELQLVPFPQVLQVVPVVPLDLPAGGTFHVHDALDPWGNLRDGQAAAGFEQHLVALGDQALHQRHNGGLEQRFAPGDLDQLARVGPDPVQHLFHRGRLPLVEGVGCVTPDAPQVAARQTHEYARAPDVGGLSLNGKEDLVDDEPHGTHFTPRHLRTRRTCQGARLRGIHPCGRARLPGFGDAKVEGTTS